MEIRKKIVIWCGNSPNQKALVNKIHQKFDLAGIVVDQKKNSLRKYKKNLFLKLSDHIRFRKINNAWERMQKFYQLHYKKWPDVPLVEVSNINSDNTLDFSTKQKPDLIVVSGTSIIKEPLISLPVKMGIMNLHTGLSPYVKGGPNCTNWCIANNEWHLIGNTIMWINSGIDTGNIITSEVIDIRNSPTLYEAHIKVMECAHDLYLRAISYIFKNDPPYISIPQDSLGKGNLFLTKMWGEKEKKKLLKNWANRNSAKLKDFPKTISLPHES